MHAESPGNMLPGGIVSVVTIRDTSTVRQAGLSHSESGWWPLELGRHAIYYKSWLMLPEGEQRRRRSYQTSCQCYSHTRTVMQKS